MDAPGLALVNPLYDQLAENGEENSGTQAFINIGK